MRLALSALALSAAAALAPAPAQAYEVCTPLRVAGVCAGYYCEDLCGPRPFVYAWCEHPLPYAWCDLVQAG